MIVAHVIQDRLDTCLISDSYLGLLSAVEVFDEFKLSPPPPIDVPTNFI